jgi:hypothetical protein
MMDDTSNPNLIKHGENNDTLIMQTIEDEKKKILIRIIFGRK